MIPVLRNGSVWIGGKQIRKKMARPARFERTTTCLEGRCSIQLSYGRTPVKFIKTSKAETQVCILDTELVALKRKISNQNLRIPLRIGRKYRMQT